jgi:hypothetical protein
MKETGNIEGRKADDQVQHHRALTLEQMELASHRCHVTGVSLKRQELSCVSSSGQRSLGLRFSRRREQTAGPRSYKSFVEVPSLVQRE